MSPITRSSFIIALFATTHACIATHIFSPGFGNSKQCEPPIHDAITFCNHLQIIDNTSVSTTACLDSNNETELWDGLAHFSTQDDNIYIPIYADHDARCTTSYMCQEKDIADIFKTHLYVCTHHHETTHFIGHSRGAGTIIVYLGLLTYDIDYLITLAEKYFSDSAKQVLHEYEKHELQNMLRQSVGAVMLFSPFDNLGETMDNIVRQQIPLPKVMRKKLARNIVWPYRKGITKNFADITYKWENPYTPRAMMKYVDEHIPFIFVHAAKDNLVPAAVSHDLHRIRNATPNTKKSTKHIIPNTSSHIDIYRYIPQYTIDAEFKKAIASL